MGFYVTEKIFNLEIGSAAASSLAYSGSADIDHVLIIFMNAAFFEITFMTNRPITFHNIIKLCSDVNKTHVGSLSLWQLHFVTVKSTAAA